MFITRRMGEVRRSRLAARLASSLCATAFVWAAIYAVGMLYYLLPQHLDARTVGLAFGAWLTGPFGAVAAMAAVGFVAVSVFIRRGV